MTTIERRTYMRLRKQAHWLAYHAHQSRPSTLMQPSEEGAWLLQTSPTLGLADDSDIRVEARNRNSGKTFEFRFTVGQLAD